MPPIKPFQKINAQYNQLNRYLITHRPFLWQTQIHLVLIFALVWGTIGLLTGILYPVHFQTLCSENADLSKIKLIWNSVFIGGSILFLIGWRSKIAQYKKSFFSWKSSILEVFIYLAGVLILWLTSNAFNLGINTKIAYFTLSKDKNQMEILEKYNYLTPFYTVHEDIDKARALDNYFADADSLMHLLLNKALKTTEPNLRIKKYYKNTQLPGAKEYFGFYSTSYQSPKMISETSPYGYYDVYRIDTAALVIRDELYKIDTGTTNYISKNLMFSFDEFIPKINYDNYYTIEQKTNIPHLGYQNYKELITQRHQYLSELLLDDAIRTSMPEKMFIARDNFLESLSPNEKITYKNIFRDLSYIFGLDNYFAEPYLLSGAESFKIEKNLQQELNADWNYNGSYRQNNFRNYAFSSEEYTYQYQMESSKLTQLSQKGFYQDSVALKEQYTSFLKSISPEAKFWFESYIQNANSYLSIYHKMGKENEPYGNTNHGYYINIPNDSFSRKSSNKAIDLYNELLFEKENMGYKLDKRVSVIMDSLKLTSYLNGLEKTKNKQNNNNYMYNSYSTTQYILAKALPEWYPFYPFDAYTANNQAPNYYYRLDYGTPNVQYNYQFNQSIPPDYLYNFLSGEKDSAAYTKEFDRYAEIIRAEVLKTADDSTKFLLDLFGRYNSNYLKDVNWKEFKTIEIYSAKSYLENPAYFINKKFSYDISGYKNLLNSLYLEYKYQNLSSEESASIISFFKNNGFDIPAADNDKNAQLRAVKYLGTDLLRGIREVYHAKNTLKYFLQTDVFQPYILALLMLIGAVLFFSVGFDTGTLTTALALGFMLLIILNFFLTKFIDEAGIATAATDFPTLKQKIVFFTLLAPLLLAGVSLAVVRRRIKLPGFMMNMTVVFILALLTTNPKLYYGDHLQKVEKLGGFINTATNNNMTQMDLFYYLTLYLGISITLCSILLRYNKSLPKKN